MFSEPTACPIKGCEWPDEDSDSDWPEHRDNYHDRRTHLVGCDDHETWADDCAMCIMNHGMWVNKAAYDAMGRVP